MINDKGITQQMLTVRDELIALVAEKLDLHPSAILSRRRVLGKLLNRSAAYVLGKEIKLLLIDKACKWLLEWETHQREDIEVVEQFRKAMEGE